MIDLRTLRRLAGAATFARGGDYASCGKVRILVEEPDSVTAGVQGTDKYDVRLWLAGSELEYTCTCPVGRDGAFCKHCVAVAIAWLGRHDEDAGERSVKPSTTMDDVRAYLRGLGTDALVDLVTDQAKEDERLHRRLLMEAAKKTPAGGPDLATYRASIDHAVEIHGFVDYRGSYQYARGIEDTIDAIERLVKDGHAAAVIDLTEYALKAVEGALGSVDDSDGELGDILRRLQNIHLTACRKAKPAPEALARRLFEWELRTGWDTFFGAADTYAAVLGQKGLAIYQRLAEAEWARVPPLDAGGDARDKYGRRFRISHIMETLARRTGDVEAIVAVKKRDLSRPYGYLQIAETYRNAGQYDAALEWAERGMKTFPQRQDPRLREFLAAEYHRRGQDDNAMALIWAAFGARPILDEYRNLKRHADRVDRWAVWREKALDRIREEIAGRRGEGQEARWRLSGKPDHSELVRVLLWERKVEAAWREAVAGGCTNDLWLELAAKREQNHPEEVLPIYQRQIEPTLARTNNEAYRAGITLLRKVHALLRQLGREGEFGPYVEAVRARFKMKRNFVKLLDRARWT